MYMVRKQLYIEDAQEQRLKRRARELGVSEAELMRRALDGVLWDSRRALRRPAAAENLRQFFHVADQSIKTIERFKREELYEDRIRRLPRR